LCYPLLLVLTLLLWPSLWLRTHVLERESAAIFDLATFGLASFAIAIFYTAAEREADRPRWHRRILDLPVVFALGIGLAVNNTIAVFEALLGHESPFVRTPKHAITGTSGTWRNKVYLSKRSLTSIVEIALGFYLIGTVVYSASQQIYWGLPFLGLFAFGYLYMGLLSLTQGIRLPRLRARRAIDARALHANPTIA
jgi:hypothetical protein